MAKRSSKELTRTENCNLGALARLDDFLMNPPSRNALSTSQGTNEDDSQNNLNPEAGLLQGQMTQNSGPEDGHDLVTGATDQIGNCHDMTGVHEEVTFCPLKHFQGSRRKTALPVNCNSAVKTPLRRSKQTKFCWPFSSWQLTTTLRTFITTSTDFPNCQSH